MNYVRVCQKSLSHISQLQRSTARGRECGASQGADQDSSLGGGQGNGEWTRGRSAATATLSGRPYRGFDFAGVDRSCSAWIKETPKDGLTLARWPGEVGRCRKYPPDDPHRSGEKGRRWEQDFHMSVGRCYPK